MRNLQNALRRNRVGRSKFGQSKIGKALGINARRKNIPVAVEDSAQKQKHISKLSGKTLSHKVIPGKLKDAVDPEFNAVPKRIKLNPEDFTVEQKLPFPSGRPAGVTSSRIVFIGKSDIGPDRIKAKRKK